jgi:hypothetical protein
VAREEAVVMEYRVIEEVNVSDLIIEVNNAIKQGWKPQGGICAINKDQCGSVWAQAIIK